MFREMKTEDISFNDINNRSIEMIGKVGFQKYEQMFHAFEVNESDKKILDNIISFCKVDMKKINDIVGIVDSYIEQKIAGNQDAAYENIDEIFDQDKFIDMIKPYKENVVLPVMCYWEMLKQTFTQFDKFENIYNDSIKRIAIGHRSYEERVHDVSKTLVSWLPYAPQAGLVYTLVTGKTVDEALCKLDETISKKIVDVTDATTYLAANFGIGCFEVVENAAEYVASTIATLSGNKEQAEKIISTDISGELKDKLDEWYGRDNFVSAIGESVEKFGTTATYIGLSVLLSTGGLQAVAAGVGLAMGKAGEVMKQDYSKTGELTSKEVIHSTVVGVTMVGAAIFGKKLGDLLNSDKVGEKIASGIYENFGRKINDAKVLRSAKRTVIKSLDSGVKFATTESPEILSKKLEQALKIDPNAKADWSRLIKGTLSTMLVASVFSVINEYREISKNPYYSTYEERKKCTPSENGNGKWLGERGNSLYKSNDPRVLKYLKEANVEGPKYNDYCADLSPFAKAEVKIKSMSSARHSAGGRLGNFEQADAALAKMRGDGCTARDVANWRKANGYTWHELNDMKTCQMIPIEINRVFKHLGGVGECKRKEEMLEQLIGTCRNKGGIFDE